MLVSQAVQSYSRSFFEVSSEADGGEHLIEFLEQIAPSDHLLLLIMMESNYKFDPWRRTFLSNNLDTHVSLEGASITANGTFQAARRLRYNCCAEMFCY